MIAQHRAECPLRLMCPVLDVTPAGGNAPTTQPAPHEAENRSLVRFGSGSEWTVHAGEKGIRLLLVSGTPLAEPVAWYGPIVMNTRRRCGS